MSSTVNFHKSELSRFELEKGDMSHNLHPMIPVLPGSLSANCCLYLLLEVGGTIQSVELATAAAFIDRESLRGGTGCCVSTWNASNPVAPPGPERVIDLAASLRIGIAGGAAGGRVGYNFPPPPSPPNAASMLLLPAAVEPARVSPLKCCNIFKTFVGEIISRKLPLFFLATRRVDFSLLE